MENGEWPGDGRGRPPAKNTGYRPIGGAHGSTRGRSRSPPMHHSLPRRPSAPYSPAVERPPTEPRFMRDNFRSGQGWSRVETGGAEYYRGPPRKEPRDRDRSMSPPPRGRRGSRSWSTNRSPSPRGRRTRSSSPNRRSRTNSPQREGVFKGLDKFTRSLQTVMQANGKRALATRALDRLAGFNADGTVLAHAQRAAETAERHLRVDTEALSDAFIDLLRGALAAPGVAKGDMSALQLEKLADRIADLEKGVPKLKKGEVATAEPASPVPAPPSQPPPSLPPPPPTQQPEPEPTAESSAQEKGTDSAEKDKSDSAKRTRARELLHKIIGRVEEVETKMDAVLSRCEDNEESLAQLDYAMSEQRDAIEEERRRFRRRALAADTSSRTEGSVTAPTSAGGTPAPAASAVATVGNSEMVEMRKMMEKMQEEIVALKASQAAPNTSAPMDVDGTVATTSTSQEVAATTTTSSEIAQLRTELDQVRKMVSEDHLRPVISKLLRESLPPVLSGILVRQKEDIRDTLMTEILAMAGRDRSGRLFSDTPTDNGSSSGHNGPTSSAANPAPASAPRPSSAGGETPRHGSDASAAAAALVANCGMRMSSSSPVPPTVHSSPTVDVAALNGSPALATQSVTGSPNLNGNPAQLPTPARPRSASSLSPGTVHNFLARAVKAASATGTSSAPTAGAPSAAAPPAAAPMVPTLSNQTQQMEQQLRQAIPAQLQQQVVGQQQQQQCHQYLQQQQQQQAQQLQQQHQQQQQQQQQHQHQQLQQQQNQQFLQQLGIPVTEQFQNLTPAAQQVVSSAAQPSEAIPPGHEMLYAMARKIRLEIQRKNPALTGQELIMMTQAQLAALLATPEGRETLMGRLR